VLRISVEEAKAQIDDGQAVLVDVRSRVFYDESHAAGAISAPETELDAYVDDLPRDRSLVLY
jgi:rhodanese-related sulfurtransferase